MRNVRIRQRKHVAFRVITLLSFLIFGVIECTAQWNTCSNLFLGSGQGAHRRLDLTFVPEQNWSSIPINTEFYFNFRENDTANFNLNNVEERTFFYSMIDSLNYLYSHLNFTDTCSCTLDGRFVPDTKIAFVPYFQYLLDTTVYRTLPPQNSNAQCTDFFYSFPKRHDRLNVLYHQNFLAYDTTMHSGDHFGVLYSMSDYNRFDKIDTTIQTEMRDIYTYVKWQKEYYFAHIADSLGVEHFGWDSDSIRLKAGGLAQGLGHELGHALGLTHIAYTDVDDTNVKHYGKNKCKYSIMNQKGDDDRRYLPASEVGHIHVGLCFSNLQFCIPIGTYVGTKHITTHEEWPKGRFYYDLEIMPEGSLTLNCGATMPSRAYIGIRGSMNLGEEEIIADRNNHFGGIRVFDGGVLRLNKSSVSQYDIVVDDGGTIIIEDTLTVSGKNKVFVREGGYVCFGKNACLNLVNCDSRFVISGNAVFGINPSLSYEHVCSDSCSVVGNGEYVLTTSDIDLYIRDNSTDNGSVSSSNNYFNSPDIEVVNSSYAHIEDNSLTGGESYVVKVTIHNKGTETSSGTENISLYWSAAVNNAVWPTGWKGDSLYYCASANDSLKVHGVIVENYRLNRRISAGSSETFYIEWPIEKQPNLSFNMDCFGGIGNHDFGNCSYSLIAVIDDGKTVANINDTVLSSQFIRASNNVASKSINYLRGSSNSSTLIFGTKNAFPESHPNYCINISSKTNTSASRSILDVADVYVTMSEYMFDNWAYNGRETAGLRYLKGRTFQVIDTNATIYNIEPMEDDVYSMEITVSPISKRYMFDADFEFDVTQTKSTTVFSGSHFVFHYEASRIILASANASLLSTEENTYSLDAANAGEPASYKWYDESNSEIGSGLHIIDTLTTKTQNYLLEVTSEIDNYKSYDSLTIVLPVGVITSISPNPVENIMQVMYRIEENVRRATLIISNLFGQVVDAIDIPTNSNSMSINTSSYFIGTYTVTLTVNDVPVDSKSIIKTNNK